MLRVSRTTLALCFAGLIACGGNSTPSDAGKVCALSSDCTGTDVCVNKQCVPICHQSSDCASQGSGLVCEEGICTAPACGSDAECGTQACIGGSCRTPTSSSDVASCEVTPNPADAHVGAKLGLKAVALGANGEAVVWNQFTWAATGAAATIDASGNLTSTAAGDVTVTATVTGTTKTCTSTVHSYAAVAANSRVVVINQLSKEPVQGAKVLVCNHPAGSNATCPSTATTTDASGTITFSATGPQDVHVFAVGYNYTSYISTTASDMLVPIAPYVNDNARSGFTSHMCDATKADDPANGDPNCPPEGDFTPLADQGQAVHLAFFGSGIANSLLDISVDTLVGPLHPVTVSIAGTTKTINLPWGLVLGIGSDFFGTNDYRVFADPGVRALWGLGGNLNLSSVVSIITPLLNNSTGGNIDIGTLLPQLLGFVGNLQAGAVVGVKAPANAATPTFDNSKPVALNSRMRLAVNLTSPKLPKLDGVYLDGVIGIVGAMDYPIGFVPLGITAGLSAKDNAGGVLDPTCDTSGGTTACDTNKVPMKFAPMSGGTEGSTVGAALLAVNFGGLTPGSTAKVAISGQIVTKSAIAYTKPGDTPPTIAPPNFLALPASTSVTATKATRNLTITGDANDASVVQVYRFEIESNARLTWSVWMPPTGSATAAESIYLPTPPGAGTTSCDGTVSLCDPFNQTPSARLLSLSLGGGVTGPTNIETFGDASGVRVDEIGTALTAFTALQVNVQ